MWFLVPYFRRAHNFGTLDDDEYVSTRGASGRVAMFSAVRNQGKRCGCVRFGSGVLTEAGNHRSTAPPWELRRSKYKLGRLSSLLSGTIMRHLMHLEYTSPSWTVLMLLLYSIVPRSTHVSSCFISRIFIALSIRAMHTWQHTISPKRAK